MHRTIHYNDAGILTRTTIIGGQIVDEDAHHDVMVNVQEWHLLEAFAQHKENRLHIIDHFEEVERVKSTYVELL